MDIQFMFMLLALMLLLVVIVVLLIDVIPIFKDWLGRIHIGRYPDKAQWGKSITNIGIQWLNKTPKIKVTDNNRIVALDMIKGDYSKSAIQHWQEAAILLGLSECMLAEPNKEIEQVIKEFVHSKFTDSGEWRVKPQLVDASILAYGLMKQKVINLDQFHPALDEVWHLIQAHIGDDGTVQYRKSMRDYRYVDTIGFICPFLVTYGIQYNKPECLELAVNQIQHYERFGMLKDQQIPFHAYHISNHYSLGLNGWGRGLGWFAIGLIDAWTELPQDHEYKKVLETSVIQFAQSAMLLQNPEGNWNWTAVRPESRADSSATATLSWFLLNASTIDSIAAECMNSVDLAMSYLMKVTRRNGIVDFSQGDTKDIGVYSMLFNKLPFTQGFCIRTISLYQTKKAV